MMKKGLFSVLWALLVVLASCKDDDVNIFDKPSDVRAAEAIASLKSDLTAPANGWIVKYRPESGSGSFYVLMKFGEDNTVTIRSDLGSNDGEFYEQTMTYRIDSSLGLELIIESYSFFSFLFEQDQATFLAEYEFDYANKTPDNELVFRSKSDPSNATILLFEEASPADINLLGMELSANLNEIADDLDNFSPTLKLTYQDMDLAFYLSLDELRRTLYIKGVSRKTTTASAQNVGFSSPYVIEGNTIVLDEPLTGTFFGNNISLESIAFDDDLAASEINACADPIPTHVMEGTTGTGDDITLEPTLVDVSGIKFTTLSDFYSTPIQNVFFNGFSAGNEIAQDIAGAQQMQLYYNSGGLYAMGFYIVNADGTAVWALREFTASLTDNRIEFDFAPTVTLFPQNATTDANLENVNNYLNAITEGGTTYVFEYSEGIYEFYNPCTGWTVAF
ncbi:MAG TPA: DUF4302 domain-containing protein, partial [Ohtaekwangia sp.]|nr:DUF4302 domain-containing protein [Ohtaekwangia sp.]